MGSQQGHDCIQFYIQFIYEYHIQFPFKFTNNWREYSMRKNELPYEN